ncbi:pyruvate carboxylase [Anaeromyxobacter dehalogenans 2CP-1]|uniref:Pyruvate carboxylase n=1 Tax=Anaeromyxobacter dehalogenans (strain ATCC BAA-258 / DSM 21875 / 2CP-1) TaxID=455488 RepID=B8JGR3_ANAD2|nr:pyruvate carboxylase [Anaeromyxobacter dehalogenans]ACL66550.1 pyruvate carboxylase [Anaeromyxobacter dehalogenans 2CP-1]
MTIPFKRVMAANRGEIAIRIFRACTELGIQTVAIYSEEDRLSLHRYKADEAYLVGKGKPPIDAYLGIEEIVELARRLEVDAIHPGYGFLSENPEFSEACERAGIAFVGPTSEMQRKLGDKVAGRKAAQAAGVPVVPGTPEPILHDEEALIFAKQHGYPIIIKASAGGGGRGMRVARSQKELLEGLVSARSEARAAFGNAAVFLERYIERPKHIEVQVLGDHHGELVHLFERDCSIQRRHQKVVEFAPSLALTEAQREAICGDALKIARSVRYRNAGTVEFLVDPQGRHYFIEVNPRIQVEHTVTESITGRNLVQAQLLVAQGRRLSDPEIGIARQQDVQRRGFAVQCRITTEDPQNGFAPDYGVLKAYRSPGGFGVRLDAGSAFTGAVITPHYDSLLVKITTWGLTLDAAAHVMDRSLQEFRVRGVKTNIAFLENVMRHPVFLSGRCDTSFIEDHPELLAQSERKDRGTKLLRYLADVTVNGSPGVSRATRPADIREPRLPKVDLTRPRPKGTRDILLERGPEGLARWVLAEKRLLFTDTTMRDAHQSLLATRVRTHDLLRIAPATGVLGAGLFSLEMWGGATFDVAMRFLREDPWERLHKLRKEVPNVLFQMLLRGSNAVGYTNYPDNVVERFVEEAARSGIDVFRVFDSLNWTRGMKVAMEAVRRQGKVCEAAVCYTGDIDDPRRDKYPLDYYVKLAKELERMGAHFLAVKDMAGLLKPFAAAKLVKALKDAVGLPVHLHTHDTSGVASATLLEATKAGVDVVDAALSPLSGLTAQPNLNSLAAVLEGSAWDPKLDRDGLQQLANYWETVRDWYAPFESGLKSGTAEVYRHEIPGGQYSNYKPQVAGLGLLDRWEECKDMYRKVNLLFGDIVKVTPSSKVVGDMAMFLVKNGLEPEDLFTDKANELAFPESVVGLARGMLGQLHGGFPERLREILLRGQEPITCRPGELLEPADLEAERRRAAERVGHPVDDKALVSWLLYPNVWPELSRHREAFSDTSVVPTPVFFWGLEPGQETSVEIEPGKTLIVKLVSMGKLEKDGTRDLIFELNGEGRTITVRDASAAQASAARVKAERGNPAHVGAPMPGKVLKVNVKPGDEVKAGAVLLVTEAMKMETNVKAKGDCRVAEVRFKEGDKVEKEDLLLVLG